MPETSSAGAALAAQYLAARGEAESARQTAEQFTARAIRADGAAEELRSALLALEQPVPDFPPVPPVGTTPESDSSVDPGAP